MQTNADGKNALAKPRPAGVPARRQALTVLEQMFGYFSFDPMPMEAESHLAA